MSGIIFHSMPNEKNELTDNTVGHLSSHIEAMVNGKIFISNRIASCVNFIFKIYFSLSLSLFSSLFLERSSTRMRKWCLSAPPENSGFEDTQT